MDRGAEYDSTGRSGVDLRQVRGEAELSDAAFLGPAMYSAVIVMNLFSMAMTAPLQVRRLPRK